MFKNAAAEFVYYRTYSKWDAAKNRRETWPETVDRVLNFLKEDRGNVVPPKVFKKIKEAMLSFNVLPSMRLVWAAGEAARKSNVTIYNCSFLPVDSIEAFSECAYILCCGTGVGFSVEKKYVEKLPVVKPLDIAYMPKTCTVGDSKEGWADSIKFLLEGLYEGKDLKFDYSSVRPKGSILKTMGGRASGPEPLIVLHSFIKEVFNKAQGRQLTSLECHDIMNKIAEIVVAGGVRRSSQISLSDLTDEEMRDSKIWPFPLHRAMANNSAVYYEKPTAVEFLKEWSALASSGTGERGISNLGSTRTFAPKRRKGNKIDGFNPCVSGDTLLLTKEGYHSIESLVDSPITIWNGFEWSEVTPRITGENQTLLKIKFSDGRELKCTPYHKFYLADGYSGKSIKVEANQLKLGDKLIKHELPVLDSGKKADFNPYAQGFKSAEGMDNYNFLWLYEPKFMCSERLGNTKQLKNNKISVKCDAPYPKNYVPFDLSLEDQLNWLAGLLDGDGCELKEGGVQLSSIDFIFLTNLQNLLAQLGTQSKIVPGMPAGYRKLPDGHGSHKDFWCQESKRICIGAMQIEKLKELGFKCERLLLEKSPQRDASQFCRVVSIEDIGIVDKVYCFDEPKRHLGLFNGIITGQCHEIALRSNEFCNLSTVIVNENDDVETLLEKVETATWIGAIQATFTECPYLRPDWKTNCDEERLLGVSLSGQMDNPDLLTADVLKALRQKALKVAKRASERLGINMPVAITCGKPEGTTSQLVFSGSGAHPWYAPYFIRRYRISANDPLYKMMQSQGFNFSPENGQTKDNANTWVISFPCKAPDTAKFREDVSALDQLEWYKKIQTNWCEHNQSITVYVKDNEWFDVGNWVYKNWDICIGVSFLPYSGGHYQQAPYEEITKEHYEKMLADFPTIDYSKLSEFEAEDSTEGAKTFACIGDRCEIK